MHMCTRVHVCNIMCVLSMWTCRQVFAGIPLRSPSGICSHPSTCKHAHVRSEYPCKWPQVHTSCARGPYVCTRLPAHPSACAFQHTPDRGSEPAHTCACTCIQMRSPDVSSQRRCRQGSVAGRAWGLSFLSSNILACVWGERGGNWSLSRGGTGPGSPRSQRLRWVGARVSDSRPENFCGTAKDRNAVPSC